MDRDNNSNDISRRDFLKRSGTLAASLGFSVMLGNRNPVFSQQNKTDGSSNSDSYYLAAVRNGTPDRMFDAGIKALGGMERFISKGDRVVLKPNASFNTGPESGATTNPLLVKRIVEHCLNSGAEKVYVIDNILTRNAYRDSGILQAVNDAGGTMVNINSSSGYSKVKVPGGKRLTETEVHELVLEADKIINIPVLKNHMSTGISCSLKNLMGLVWDRSYYHRNNLEQCIADFPLFRMPDLTVVDAYYVMLDGGPQGRRSSTVLNPRMQFLSPDIVAADSAAVAQAGSLKVRGSSSVGYLKMAADHRLGITDLSRLNIARIVL